MMHSDHLSATFAALADPTRRAILARLASGEASVMELARPFAMSQPAISKHLKVFEGAGLISRGRDATRSDGRVGSKPSRSTKPLAGSRVTVRSGKATSSAWTSSDAIPRWANRWRHSASSSEAARPHSPLRFSTHQRRLATPPLNLVWSAALPRVTTGSTNSCRRSDKTYGFLSSPQGVMFYAIEYSNRGVKR